MSMKKKHLMILLILFPIACKVDAQKDFRDKSKCISTNFTLNTYGDTLVQKQVVTRLNDIIFNYYNSEVFFSLWSDGILTKWRSPCIEISSIVNRYDLDPLLLSIQDVDSNRYRAKVAFLFLNTQKAASEIYAIYNFILKRSEDGLLKFVPYVELTTDSWKTSAIDKIYFKYKLTHQFNKQLALKTSKFNSDLAAFFDLKEISFEYFITDNSEELNKLLGFDLDPYMYSKNQYSGISQPINRKIFSGNGKEWYPHELVHLYTFEKFNRDGIKIHSILDEGLATWLGGSIDKELVWHIGELKAYLKNNELAWSDFSKRNIKISDSTNLHYTVGGVLCEQAYKKYGKEKLWKLVDNSNSEELLYQNICKVFGVKRDEIGELILELLDKY